MATSETILPTLNIQQFVTIQWSAHKSWFLLRNTT